MYGCAVFNRFLRGKELYRIRLRLEPHGFMEEYCCNAFGRKPDFVGGDFRHSCRVFDERVSVASGLAVQTSFRNCICGPYQFLAGSVEIREKFIGSVHGYRI